MRKLEIGAGEYQRPGYEQLDFRALPGIQYVCDARKLPFEDGSFDELYCMVEGTPILTKNGFRKIEAIIPGDLVWTHRQRWRPVINSTKFHTKELLKIKIGGCPQGLLVTKNHPILSRHYPSRKCGVFDHSHYKNSRLEDSIFVISEKLTRQHFLVAPLPDFVESLRVLDLANLLSPSKVVQDYESIMLQHSKHKSWMRGNGALAVASVKGRTSTQLRGWFYHNKKPFGYYTTATSIISHFSAGDIEIPRFIPVDEELMRLFGYYLADGSLDWSGSWTVGFHFNINEWEYIRDVQTIIKNKFRISSTDIYRPQKTNKGLSIRYCSKVLHNIISGLVGPEKAHKKKIPAWILWAEPYLQMALVEGFLRGDGSVGREGKHYLATVSWELAEELRLLLLRNGITAGISRHDYRRKPEKSKFRGCGWIYFVTYRISKSHIRNSAVIDKRIVSRVLSVDSVLDSNQAVYGLQVKDDESFYACGAMHHNSSQTLEHFSHLETDAVLKEWVRVIKPGGKLILRLPDFLGIYRQFLEGEEIWEGVIVRLYGHQDYPGNTHFTMFRHDYFKPFLERAGLENITITRFEVGDGFEAIGEKP